MSDRPQHESGQTIEEARSLLIRTEGSPGAVRVVVGGELDMDSGPALFEVLEHTIDTSGASVVVDLGDVTFIDSSGVRVLYAAHRLADGRLRLGALHPNVQRVLELAGALDVFSFELPRT